MSYIEKEKLIKADIASIENRVRHAFNQGYDLGFKDGKERAKPLEQEPTTKNDLGVDAISRIETIDYLCKHCPDDGECFKDCDEIKHLRELPSVTPQEPRKGHWIDINEHHYYNDGDIETTELRCSCCNEEVEWDIELLHKPYFCENCGADMREMPIRKGKPIEGNNESYNCENWMP